MLREIPLPACLQGKRVLIVEDDRLISLDIAEAMHELGAQVTGPKHTVEAALQSLKYEPRPDVALLDLGLEDKQSALVVAEELHARHIPFVIYSGYPSTEVDRR